MKSSVEILDPTSVKLTVEVPHEELGSQLDAAYKEIGSQIQVPGFRRGHVPARVIDQRVGRGTVIEQAINAALPDLYRDAMVDSGRVPLLQPEIEIVEIPAVNGPISGQFSFTATVTVRPEFEIPSLEGTELTVDATTVSDEDVDAELDNLRARFGSLKPINRKAKTGDFLTIDLKAEIDGQEVDSVSGISYEVGKGNLLKGLDTALRGLKTDESATFTTTLAGGEHAGEEAEVTVKVTAAKQRELPEADDDFAQMASEFDTIEELREDLRKQVADRKTADQAIAARDALLEHLKSVVEFPVPEAVVEAQISQHLAAEGKEGDEEHAKEIRPDAEKAVVEQLLLDVLAEKLDVAVTQDELFDFLLQTAQQYGMEPGQFLQGAQQAGQIPAFAQEIARNKSLAVALREVTVKDSEGNVVDLSEFIGTNEENEEAAAEDAEEAPAEDAE